MTEFEKFAYLDRGLGTATLARYDAAMGRCINPAAIDVFSRLLTDRVIWLGCPVDDDVANIVQAQLLFLSSADPSADISLYINSPGGSVSAGLGIYDTMQIVSPDVATVCTGMAASMGSILLCAGAAGKRSALPHSRVMIHQPLGDVRGQAEDILIEAREIERCRKELYGILSHHSGQPVEKIFADADRNCWMSADEAKGYGMIDRILVK